jgi:hypothetical protein
LAAVLAVGCTTQPTATPSARAGPTAAQAEELFADIVAVAVAGNLNRLCDFGTGNCESILEAAGTMVPSAAPRIAVNELMSVARGTHESDTARLLVVCGLADDGDRYVTEIAVLWEGTRLVAAEPIYWSGMRVSTSGTGNESEPPPASPPPGC